MKAPGEKLEQATAIATRFIADLKAMGLKSFRGDVLDADGIKIWTLDLVFERPASRAKEEE